MLWNPTYNANFIYKLYYETKLNIEEKKCRSFRPVTYSILPSEQFGVGFAGSKNSIHFVC